MLSLGTCGYPLRLEFRIVQLGHTDDPAYYGRLREMFNAFRRALLAGLTAVVLSGVGAAWNPLAFIPAAIAFLFAVIDALLVVRGAKATTTKEWAKLLDGKPCRAGDARAGEYGVDVEVLPTGQRWHYISRDFEDALRKAIEEALSGTGSRLVMLSGPTKSGKTRAAFQALGWDELRDAQLLVPRDGASVEILLRDGVLPTKWKPVVVWLDDIEKYAAVDASGLHPGTLRNLQCDRPVLLLATEGGRGRQRYTKNSELVDPVQQLGNVAARIEVAVELSAAELSRTQESYGERFTAESEQVGLGRRMVAIGELRGKLTTGRRDPLSDPCREGVAVIRAVIDWRRMGAQSPLSIEQIGSLYRHYLPDDLDPTGDLLDSGMRWAREPLPKTDISLLPKATDGTDRFEPYDLAVDVGEKEWPSISWQVQEQIAKIVEPLDSFLMATAAYEAGNKTLALQLVTCAESSNDRRLSGISAYNAGLVLAEIGKVEQAEAAYRRAEERGIPDGAVGLGDLLNERGDHSGAEAAYRRADERGSPDGAVNFGVLLKERGDLDGAEAAWRRADEYGDPDGAHNLGVLLKEERGDLDGAEAAFRRADERGSPHSAVEVGVILSQRGDLDGAEAAFRRADERGSASGAYSLGNFLLQCGDLDGAEAAYRRADERGDSDGAHNHGVLRSQRGDLDGAEAAWRRADERGSPNSAFNTGVLLSERGDLDGAEAAFRRADERGSARGALNLGVLLKKRGDLEGSEAAFRRARERGAKPE